MRLKSSNKKEFPSLIVLGLVTILLFSLKSVNLKKQTKFPNTPDFIQKTSLDLIQISINEKAYNKLNKKRNKALSVGILETKDSDYVPATITFNGVEYKAEVRLKGDWTDHLKGDKWSFRVKLKGEETILGMRKFSIHHPKTRGYINEWLYHKAIKKENLIGLRYGFLEGVIHIKKENSSNYVTKEVGMYAIEETFDKRMLENNQRKESIILKIDENNWWQEVKKSIEVGSHSGVNHSRFMKSINYPVVIFSESKMLQDSVLRNYFELSKFLLRNMMYNQETKISDVFDAKKLAMDNAILNLFGAVHGNYIINIRFYYNPITSKLEPIAFDGNSGNKLQKYVPTAFTKDKNDSIYDRELMLALRKVSSQKYLDELINENEKEFTELEEILKTEFNMNLLSIDNLRLNQSILKQELLRLQEKLNINEN